MKYLSSLKNKNLANKTCLLRVDFNITDNELSEKNLRIQAVLPTIKFLIGKGAKVIILSHRGRPLAKVQSSKLKVKSFSLKPFIKILSGLLKKPVHFIDFNNFPTSDVGKLKNMIQNLAPASIFLLENLRFLPGEDKNDTNLAKKLASLGDLYVNDAFSVSHRENASVVAITKFLPSYAGFCLENEIKNLSKVICNPKKPLIIILGGAKISNKIGVIKNFLQKADKFLIGGDYEKEIAFLSKFEKVILPVDCIREKGKIFDIGPKTSQNYAEFIKNAKTIIWNGPMGYIENPKFRKGSEAIIEAIIKSAAFSIIGGGETTNFVSSIKYKVSSSIFLSTGGGAMLEYLSAKKLPGIKALN